MENVCCHGNVLTEPLPRKVLLHVCSLLRERVFGEPLASNGLPLWIQYSGFQASCHNTNRTSSGMWLRGTVCLESITKGLCQVASYCVVTSVSSWTLVNRVCDHHTREGAWDKRMIWPSSCSMLRYLRLGSPWSIHIILQKCFEFHRINYWSLWCVVRSRRYGSSTHCYNCFLNSATVNRNLRGYLFQSREAEIRKKRKKMETKK
jgi:hypothetical protein